MRNIPVILGLIAMGGMAMADQPADRGRSDLETGQLGAGLTGNVEIPRLGTSDGRTIYCVY